MTPGIYEICFTGFDAAKKRELIELADGATNDMFVVRNSVTKTLDILCCGETAGPKKVADAQSKGIHIFDEEQFRKLLEKGLITVDGTDARPEPQPLPALEVCFTGFGDVPNQKEFLVEKAEKSGLITRTGITKNLSFLCCRADDSAQLGMTKIADALVSGISIISELEFLDLLETGELPDDPWLYRELFSKHGVAVELLSIIHKRA
ncbi:BRCT domain-containing protein [Aeromonas dhakensis]|uniref:BRCT domain-containing protein n=1 Tax=Aeromonas dhakensis TaxID=196024 RepID=UPI00244D235D|nr:BRCT domain-containing protein [Aeromonas dhakensis]MDH0348723.1 hypothetical protein [Aeromonas dhakensis]